MTPMSRSSRTSPRPLSGRVVAITGGARGLGLAAARALAARGCRIALGDLDADLAANEAAGLGGAGPHFGAGVDVTHADAFTAFLDQVEATLGPLDVLINNAGIMLVYPFHQEDPVLTRREVEINVLGVITGSQLALQRMLPRGTGHVINIASAAGKIGLPGEATYCATKHAVVGLDESLHEELRGTGVHVTSVMPGLANTELAAGMKAGRGAKLVEPEEVADAIVGALERPRLDVYVPAHIGPLLRMQAVMPRRVRDWISRAFQTDKIARDVDRAGRADYAARAARSIAADKPAGEAEAEAEAGKTA